MRKFEKRFILLLLAVLLAAALTACGGKGGEDAGVTTLTMASFTSLDRSKKNLQNAVEQFNREHPDIQIELQDYYGEDYQTAAQNRDRLLTEITAGRGPDIIDLGSAGLPVQQLALRGYLEDLWPYIDSDPELGRESLLEAPLKSSEVNGGLYLAFDSVMIYTLVGAERIVGDRTGWTLEELQEAFAAMPEGSTVMEAYQTKEDLLYYVLSMCLGSYVDWDSGQCGFDCASFRTVMEFINSFPEQSGIDWSSWETVQRINEETIRRQREGRQMLSQTVLSNPCQIQKFDGSWGGASFVGFPMGNGSVGSVFSLSETKLAMSAGCKNKDAAWAFIRQTMLPKYGGTAAVDYFNSNIPVNRDDYEMIKSMSAQEDTFAYRTMTVGDAQVEMHAVTEAEMQRFENLLNSIEMVDLYDRDLFTIVKDASGPYFSGDKSLDETVALIQNRVQLYVNEQL